MVTGLNNGEPGHHCWLSRPLATPSAAVGMSTRASDRRHQLARPRGFIDHRRPWNVCGSFPRWLAWNRNRTPRRESSSATGRLSPPTIRWSNTATSNGLLCRSTVADATSCAGPMTVAPADSSVWRRSRPMVGSSSTKKPAHFPAVACAPPRSRHTNTKVGGDRSPTHELKTTVQVEHLCTVSAAGEDASKQLIVANKAGVRVPKFAVHGADESFRRQAISSPWSQTWLQGTRGVRNLCSYALAHH